MTLRELSSLPAQRIIPNLVVSDIDAGREILREGVPIGGHSSEHIARWIDFSSASTDWQFPVRGFRTTLKRRSANPLAFIA